MTAFTTLHHRDFRLLWFGQLVSTTGQQMQNVAIAWHVFILTDSPFEVGLIGLFRAIPFFALSLFGGASADRADRKRILLISQVTVMIATSVLAISTANGSVTPWLIYTMTLVSASAMAFENPARQALLPNLVPRSQLGNALTLNALLHQAANIVGPGLAGLIIGQFGLVPTYALSAASLTVVIGAVLLMGPAPKVSSGTTDLRDALLGGLRYLRGEPLVLSVLALTFLVSVLGSVGSLRALLPVFARDVLAVGPEGLGLLQAGASAGAVVSGVVLGAVGTGRRPIALMLAGSAVGGVLVIGFSLSSVFALSLLLLFGLGAAELVTHVLQSNIVLLQAPDEVRGRVAALSLMAAHGGPFLGQFQAGALASAVGPTASAVIGGCGVVLATASIALLPVIRRASVKLGR